jgi:transposase
LGPLGRVSELLCDLSGCQVSEDTLVKWVERLVPTRAQIADWLSASRLQHADETGMRIAGKRRWLHVTNTGFLTPRAWHAKRGRQALEDLGIWPRFRGRAMRDRLSSYDHYRCAQSICGAHLLRDCVYGDEQEQQLWAAEMVDLRLRMAEAAEERRQRGVPAVPAEQRDMWAALAAVFVGKPFPVAWGT